MPNQDFELKLGNGKDVANLYLPDLGTHPKSNTNRRNAILEECDTNEPSVSPKFSIQRLGHHEEFIGRGRSLPKCPRVEGEFGIKKMNALRSVLLG